jgi:hypothetical protein
MKKWVETPKPFLIAHFMALISAKHGAAGNKFISYSTTTLVFSIPSSGSVRFHIRF